jgi:hypothetical protein
VRSIRSVNTEWIEKFRFGRNPLRSFTLCLRDASPDPIHPSSSSFLGVSVKMPASIRSRHGADDLCAGKVCGSRSAPHPRGFRIKPEQQSRASKHLWRGRERTNLTRRTRRARREHAKEMKLDCVTIGLRVLCVPVRNSVNGYARRCGGGGRMYIVGQGKTVNAVLIRFGGSTSAE